MKRLRSAIRSKVSGEIVSDWSTEMKWYEMVWHNETYTQSQQQSLEHSQNIDRTTTKAKKQFIRIVIDPSIHLNVRRATTTNEIVKRIRNLNPEQETFATFSISTYFHEFIRPLLQDAIQNKLEIPSLRISIIIFISVIHPSFCVSSDNHATQPTAQRNDVSILIFPVTRWIVSCAKSSIHSFRFDDLSIVCVVCASYSSLRQNENDSRASLIHSKWRYHDMFDKWQNKTKWWWWIRMYGRSRVICTVIETKHKWMTNKLWCEKAILTLNK